MPQLNLENLYKLVLVIKINVQQITLSHCVASKKKKEGEKDAPYLTTFTGIVCISRPYDTFLLPLHKPESHLMLK